MSDPIDREVAVFSAARRLPAEARATYLDEACAGNAPLRQRVEDLFRASEEAGAFLQDPARGAQRPADALASPNPLQNAAAPGEKVGDRIGRYKLLQQIGEGGCGVVYMAEQEEPVRRRVALKVIKLGMDTKQVIARFEAERQALALMDHPNIAKVLEAGATDTGRPYFVMELVRGIKITHYCDENHLATEARLDLFIKVAQAVQHAHQKGIIHRDLKPSNILIADHDGVPVPKIIDFGIAKATTDQRLTDKTLFTAFEQFIGTPAYMSPEQARMSGLDIDTRTDIYSLGVLLYELLTGKTPFDAQDLLAAGLDEMRRTISEQEPARPSTRLTQELVAADVRRLHSKSGIPGPKSEEETRASSRRLLQIKETIRLVRGDLDWIVMKCLEKDRARRYETANGLAMDIQRHLENEPVVARPPSGAYRFQKLVRRNKGLFAGVGAVALMLVLGVVASTWQAVRASRAEREQGRLRLQADAEKQKAQAEAGLLKKMLQGVGPSVAKGRDTAMLKEILDQTTGSVEKDLANLPEAEVELSLTLADTDYDLGRSDQMEAVARHCLQVARTKLGPENESVANSLITLGVGLLSLAQQHLGEMFAGAVPEGEKNRRLQDRTLLEAEKCCLDGLAMHRKLLGNENLEVARALNLLAQIRLTQYRLPEAETLQRESLEMYKKISGNENARVARVSKQLAGLLAFQEDRLAEAEDISRKALAIQKKLSADDTPDIARTLFMLATLLRREGKWAEAETNYLEGVTMWRRMRAGDGFEPASSLGYLSEVLLHQGKLAEAEARRGEEFEMLKRLYGSEHAGVTVSLSRLADVLQREGKLEEAEARGREALAISRKLPAAGGGSLMAVIESLDTLVSILVAQDKNVEAEQLLGEMLKSNPEGQPLLTFVLRVRSSFFARCRRWSEAIADLSKVIELDPSDDDAAFQLTVLLLEIGDRENYRSHCQGMVASFRAANAPGPLGKTAEACLLVADLGTNSAAAGQLADQALALGKNSYWVYYLQFVKGLAEYRAGHFASAVDWMDKCIGQPTMVSGPRPDGPAYLVQTMALRQLKRSEEARAALAKGTDIVNTKFLKLENAALDENWVDWLIAHILLREAQALIQLPPRTTKE